MKIMIFAAFLLLAVAGSAPAKADGQDDGCSASEGAKPAHCGGYQGTPCEGVPSTNPYYTPPGRGWTKELREQFKACQAYLREESGNRNR